jgi:hypothetical protein
VTAQEVLRLIENVDSRVVGKWNPTPSREEWEKIKSFIQQEASK